jgi:hypothetical protein
MGKDKDWKPEVDPDLDVTKLDLTTEQGYLLSRIDGKTSVEELSQLTGLSKEKVQSALRKLVSNKVIQTDKAPRKDDLRPLTSLDDDHEDEPTHEFQAVDPREFAPKEDAVPPQPAGPVDPRDYAPKEEDAEEPQPVGPVDPRDYAPKEEVAEEAQPVGPVDPRDYAPKEEDAEEPQPVGPVDPRDYAPKEETEAQPEAEEEPEASELDSLGQELEEESQDGETRKTKADTQEADSGVVREKLPTGGDLRKIYEAHFRNLAQDARMAKAREVRGALLAGLCMDSDPKVIRAILENTRATLDHARIIAQYHRNGVGLEALGLKVVYMRDGQVRKHLLRNMQTPQTILRKCITPLPMGDCFVLSNSREVTNKAKREARDMLRKKYNEATQDMRAALIIKTEARCLANLVGIPMGEKTVALLCRKTIHSVAFAQNLARYPGLSPTLIRHLMRQTVVRTNFQIKKTILNHPNCPTRLKREII